MRTPVDFNLALVQPVAPLAQRIGRQTQSCSVFAHAHSAPVHRFDVHHPERLRTSMLKLKRRRWLFRSPFSRSPPRLSRRNSA